MSDDLIERLEAYAKDWRDRAADQTIVLEAAARIRELEAKLAAQAEALPAAYVHGCGDGSAAFEQVEEAARVAKAVINAQTKYAGWGNLDEPQRQSCANAALRALTTFNAAMEGRDDE